MRVAARTHTSMVNESGSRCSRNWRIRQARFTLASKAAEIRVCRRFLTVTFKVAHEPRAFSPSVLPITRDLIALSLLGDRKFLLAVGSREAVAPWAVSGLPDLFPAQENAHEQTDDTAAGRSIEESPRKIRAPTMISSRYALLTRSRITGVQSTRENWRRPEYCRCPRKAE